MKNITRLARRGSIQTLSLIVTIAVLGVGAVAFAQTTDTTPPTIPGAVSATFTPPSQIAISWGASTDPSTSSGQASGVAGYYVYRNGGQITATGDTSYVDSGLIPGIYTYAVAAYDAAGNISRQSTGQPITVTLDTAPPSTPTLTVTAVTSTMAQTQVHLSWTTSKDNVGVAGYYVYRDNRRLSTSTINGTTYTDIVTAGTYTYSVISYDAAQNLSNSSKPATITIVFDSTPPTVPSNLSAKEISPSEIFLSWTQSTDNIAVAGYHLYRNGADIADTTSTLYDDTKLATGTIYSYYATAYDAAGNASQPSISTSNITLIPDTSPPSSPGNVTATALTSSTVTISWAPAGDNFGVTGYNVYRYDSQVGTTASTTYLDISSSSFTPGTYAYTITAFDAAGNISPKSSPGKALVPTFFPSGAANPPSTPSTAGTGTTASSSATTTSMPTAMLTAYLYFGSRNSQVTTLQSILIADGYLSSAVTGYFGNMTLKAVQKFQCDRNIVCTNDGGWGFVGTRTRAALNTGK